MPVVTAIKCGGELPWRGDIGVAIQNMTDFVRILFLDARERQLRESLGGTNVKSAKGRIRRGELRGSILSHRYDRRKQEQRCDHASHHRNYRW